MIKGGHDAIRLQAKTKKLSTNAVVKGRLPEKNNEIALSNSERHHYKIGDTFKVVDNNGKSSVTGLQNTRFTVVGFVNSSVNLQKKQAGFNYCWDGTDCNVCRSEQGRFLISDTNFSRDYV
ncbi:hypothetical protein [Secundilactobacillus kimchicus]|uniref:hypothetical protein n=1 Tax=Secundilactobacillus kimchicus TaxID=528209 RepID=UPI000A501896|nr:hypothetical protein [Secundilactobacillus kimchicus]